MKTFINKKTKTIIRDILIYLFFLTGLPFVRIWWLRRRGPLVHVLAYHDVPNREEFEDQILFLKKRFNIITPDDLKQKKFDDKKINILLTFDDGFMSWHANAAPVLKKHGLGAILFVSSGFLNTAGDKEKEKRYCKERLLISHKKPLSWEALKKILEENPKLTVGGHTVNHADLAKLPPNKQLSEIAEDKHILEDILGRKIVFFAYPFGTRREVSREAHRAVQESGYQYAFTTKIDFANIDDKMNIARVCTEPNFNRFFLYIWVLGGYDLLKRIINFR